jgi:hypothetical protein
VIRVAAFAAGVLVCTGCDPPNVVATNDCVGETAAVDGQPCVRVGSRCPLQAQPGTVCFDAGGALAASAVCTCSMTFKWTCGEDAALACSEPVCSFGAPCTAGQTCMSQSRGIQLICDPTGHFAQCNPGQTMKMGCDACVCQSGSWVCSTNGCVDAASD